PNPFKHGRVVASIVAIACGVALGLAVYLVNRIAVDEFSSAIRQLSGTADLVIAGPRNGFTETTYPTIARLPQIAVASPVSEIRATLAGRKDALKILGVDPFRAAEIHPAWFSATNGAGAELFAPDTLLLSAAAAKMLQLKMGDRIRAQVGLRIAEFRVLNVLPESAGAEAFALMDIANVQWRFERLGLLSRIELRLQPGANNDALRARIASLLPPGMSVESPDISAAQSAELSKAYRVNMMILALVALFTGVFLVFSTQALAIIRRRPQLALLRVLGLSRRRLIAALLLEGAAIGACGAALGVALGYLLAGITLSTVGADLGAGYFSGVTPTLAVGTGPIISFLALGILVALTGTLVPALEAAATPPAPALRAGSQELPLRSWARPGWGLACWGLAAVMLFAPVFGSLPLGGYAGIGLILAGTLLLLPALAKKFFAALPDSPNIEGHLALEHLRNAYGHVAMSVASLFVSFSLIVAMGIMVYSFRESVVNWLDAVLPADLYVRSGQAGESGFFDEATQRAISAVPGIAEVGFVRFQSIMLTPDQPAVALIARQVKKLMHRHGLPLVGASYLPKANEPPPIWISEAVRDLHGYQVGKVITAPIAGKLATFTVAGVWRDYARQFGALLIDRDDYIKLSGDRAANDAALFLNSSNHADEVIAALRDKIPGGAQLEFVTSKEVRAISLKIFDRSFYVTYALEVITVLIGLFGVSASFSGAFLMRRKEFGMLRHIGLTRRQVARSLSLEGAWIGVLGALSGWVVGVVLSLILIHVVTRQSFHWSMDIHVPWLWLTLLSVGLVIATALTARLSANQAMGENAVQSVREDW
ncbi:MAG: ABC transporter permease, partial [Pseudomonadota bacterium]|nr:ABC transporter permease [Pseudomonadota bacterium]